LTQAALQERFVATLAHDLRNPLSNAYLAAQLIKSNSDLTKIKEFAEGIMSNLIRMDGMIRDLLDSIKFQMGERLQLRGYSGGCKTVPKCFHARWRIELILNGRKISKRAEQQASSLCICEIRRPPYKNSLSSKNSGLIPDLNSSSTISYPPQGFRPISHQCWA
jgi:hypothetical protein